LTVTRRSGKRICLRISFTHVKEEIEFNHGFDSYIDMDVTFLGNYALYCAMYQYNIMKVVGWLEEK
jgi:hypothetical protein